VRFQTRGVSAESPLLGPGRWFWRVSARYGDNSRSSPVASVIIEQNAPLSAPALVSPPAEGAVNVSGEGDVYFSWRREAGADSYTLLVSAREDLADPLISRRVRENYYAHPAAGLGEGRYYWGVSAHDAGGNASPVSSVRPFTAAAARALVRTVFPPDAYIVAEDLLPNLRFTWKTNVSSAHRFQIASDAGFSAPFLDEPAPGETFQARRLPAGTWYWRVAAVSGGQSLYSPANRLTVIEVLPPPELGAPEGSFSGLVDQRQVVVVQPGRRMTFSWRAVTGADRYAFRLYDADEAGGMGERVFEDTVPEGTSLSLSMDNYAEGLYYWTVQPMADEGAAHSRLTGYTGTAQFNLQKTRALTLDYPPPGHEYAGFDALRQPGELRWSSIDTPRRARFILSRSRNLSGRPLMDVSDPGRTIPLVSLSEGTYYWTVRAEGSDGADISPRAPSWFRVLPMPSLEGIRNFQPADNFVFGPEQLRGLSSITFSWDEVEGANAYTFALEREDEGSAPVSIAVSGPSPQRAYTLDNLSVLARGRFVWRVEPLYRGPDGSVIRRGAVRAVRFIVDIPAVQRRNIDDMGTLYGQ
ncbi:MAG: hypothetical protein LBQ55_11240, partial [Treponema sp.]|nr:hypothetical protein [Treponema sp.]